MPQTASEARDQLVKELTHTAAVCVAILESLRDPPPALGPLLSPRGLTEQAIYPLAAERRRQDQKWGRQRHAITHWLGILGEEFGEACQAALELSDHLDGAEVVGPSDPLQLDDPELNEAA